MKNPILYLAVLFLGAVQVLAQPSNVRPPQALPAAAREQWHSRGRSGPWAADLRRQAIQQKLRLRAALWAASTFTTFGPGWNSVGPLPLPSHASGTGIQDYGWVSGRATAVAIDPNDPGGNTVFVGGECRGTHY